MKRKMLCIKMIAKHQNMRWISENKYTYHHDCKISMYPLDSAAERYKINILECLRSPTKTRARTQTRMHARAHTAWHICPNLSAPKNQKKIDSPSAVWKSYPFLHRDKLSEQGERPSSHASAWGVPSEWSPVEISVHEIRRDVTDGWGSRVNIGCMALKWV